MKSLSLRFTTLGLAYLALTLGVFAQSASTELTLNTPLAREIKADETHNYQLKLTANQFAHIVVEQQGVDAQVNVYDPAGKLVISMDSPNGTQGPEPVWLVNQSAGAYRVEVKPFTGPNQPARGGKYEITLAVLRAATPADAKVGQALAAYLEGMRLSVGPPDEARRKAAADKMQQAIRWLGDGGDAELRKTVSRGVFAVAPLSLVQQMKGLTQVPGAVTVYHSADTGPLAKEVAARFGSLVSFYQARLKTKATPTFVMLNKADWTELSGGPPFGMPIYTPDPPAMIASSDLQAIGGMLAMFKGKAPADLHSALAADGLNYEANAAPLVIEAGAGILVGMDFSNQILGRMPKPWMDVVLGSYLLHAWLGEKQTPQLARVYRIGMRIPGAVMTPSKSGLDAMFGGGDMFTAGVAFSRAATLGAQLYDTHKFKLLDELVKAFPKGQKIDAATAEARLYKLSPHIKPWVESFGSKTVVNDAESLSDQDVRAAIRLAHDALERFDKAFYEQYLADNYLETDQDGKTWSRADILQNWQTPQNSKTTITTEDLKLQIRGDLALASYRFNWRTELKDQIFINNFRVSDVLQRQQGRWRLLTEHYSVIPKPPALAQVDPKIYDDYAGTYQSDDNLKGVITREGDKLFEQMAGATLKVELLPENETTFRLAEQRWQRVFVRDAQRRVTHLLVRTPDGQEFKAIKIK